MTTEPKKLTEKDRRAALEAISVPLTGESLKAYRAWRAKADQVKQRWVVLRVFAADWYPKARLAWVGVAAASVGWEPSDNDGSCTQTSIDKSQWLDHVRDIHGRQYHLTVDETPRGAKLIARYCCKGASDVECTRREHTWTYDMRLTREEMFRGDPCKGCGRALIRSAVWANKGTMHYSAEERREADAEEAEYKRLHAACHAGRWSMSGSVITHCSRCCPPHQMSDEQIAAIVGIVRSGEERHARLKARWDGIGPRPKRPVPKATPVPDPVERLRAEADRQGYRLVKKDDD